MSAGDQGPAGDEPRDESAHHGGRPRSARAPTFHPTASAIGSLWWTARALPRTDREATLCNCKHRSLE